MSSKRFGKKTKKPKDKEAKKAEGHVSNPALKSTQATKAANFERKHFQRRTSG
jgi:hypothetical protein